MTRTPLRGRRVVVTRARAQASGLAARLTALGATVIELPVIAVEDPEDGGRSLADAADRLVAGAYGWVVLTSSNAADRLLAALGGRPVPAALRWAAVGSGTARRLADAGFSADLVPDVAVADAVAEAFPSAVAAGSSATGEGAAFGTAVLFPRAETVRSALVPGLRAKGWPVDEVVAYRTAAGRPAAGAAADAVAADAVAFTSSSTVERTVELLGADRIPPVVVTIGPVTSGSARAAGLEVAAEASPHTVEGVVDALVAVLAPDRPTPPPR
ncbi:MAG: uroporphyrinogen-III synthase [Acidimicrobiales bacterium]